MKCYYCKKEAVEKRKLCKKHAEKKREERTKKRNKWKALGLCTMCGSAEEKNSTLQCNSCNKRAHENYIKRSTKRKAENCCIMCGRNKDFVKAWDYNRCARCHLREKLKWQGSIKEAEKIINGLLKEQNYRCALTGRDLKTNKFHIDHIIPRSVDPTKIADPNNWQLVIEDANFFKKDKRAEDLFSVAVDIVKYAIECKKLLLSDLETKSNGV